MGDVISTNSSSGDLLIPRVNDYADCGGLWRLFVGMGDGYYASASPFVLAWLVMVHVTVNKLVSFFHFDPAFLPFHLVLGLITVFGTVS